MVSLIFAVDPDGVIGRTNDLPWHYPEDLRYFRDTTYGHKVLMGARTFASILARNGRPLPGREHYVLTHRRDLPAGVHVVDDLDAFLSEPRTEEVFVIGGKSVFEQAWKYADRLYITHVGRRHPGDVRLAPDLAEFALVSQRSAGELRFAVYERKVPR